MIKFTLFLSLLLMVSFQGILAQARVITGIVTSSKDNSPVPGVAVIVKSTKIGTTTNADGKYSLTIKRKSAILVFSHARMKTREITLGSDNTIDVIMVPDIVNMDEHVNTAMGISRETGALSYSVRNVSGDDIRKSAQQDVINSLSGMVSDVQVIRSAGIAGSASYIQIRGAQSLTGSNQPLWVVDGMPVSGSETGGTYDVANGSVAFSNRAADLNPDDIESINVLRGGAATALYGMRAASGAIVITTKTGKATNGKKIALNFNSSVRFDQVSKLPPLQNEFGQGSGGKWLSGDQRAWGPKIDTCAYDLGNWDDYQWKDFDVDGRIVSNKVGRDGGVKIYNPYDFFQTGITTNNFLSLSGGSDVANFYFSFSDNQQKGIVPHNKFRRNTFKIAGESKLSDHFKVGGNANYIITIGDRIQQGNNGSGLMLGLLRTPYTFDNDAGYQFSSNYLLPDDTPLPNAGNQRNYTHGNGFDNPFWTVNNNRYNDQVNRLIGSVSVDYYSLKWLSFTYRLGVDWYGRKFTDNLAIGSNAQPTGWTRRGEELSKIFNSDLIMTIDKDFAKDFNVRFILGHNMFQSYYTYLYASANGLVKPEFYSLNNTTNLTATEGTTKIRRAAIYGDLQLSWKTMLFISITGRNDWSTFLPKGKNSFFYPSFGAAWIFTQLPGLKDNKTLPYGKVRISYAIVGKDASPYNTNVCFITPAILDGSTTGLTWTYQGKNPGIYMTGSLGNSNLKPEKTKAFETGFDLKLLQNRIGLSYTYFNNKSEDLLVGVPVAATTGYTSSYMSTGSVRTTGHEITMDLVPIKSGNWEWDIEVNFSKINNKVLALAEGVSRLLLNGFIGSEIDAVVGQPYRTIWGYDWKRNANGTVLIGDDGYPVKQDNMSVLGNVDPKWTMGIGSNLRWKDLSFYFLVDIKHGGKMWDGTRGALDYFGTSAGSLNRGKYVVFDGVMEKDGTQNTMKVPLSEEWYRRAGNGITGPAQPYVEDAGWVRLRTVTLSYNLTHLLKKTFIKGLSLYFTGTNLLLFTHYKGIDPETSLAGSDNAQGIDYFNMPGTRSYTLGVNLAF